MAGLFVYRSNRLEALGEQLAAVLREPPRRALEPETIVVQSMGMRRWISLELAVRLGVTMNCDFPFFQEFAHTLLHGGEPTENAFSRSALPWRIFALLPQLVDEPAFAELRQYRGDDLAAQRRQFQLAGQIGAAFDRYIAHSPELLLEWESNNDPQWQARLWRMLVNPKIGDELHPPALLQRFIRDLENEVPSTRKLPQRVAVFGISGVPRFYLHLLRAAAKRVAVHLFLLEPTDQYWADLRGEKEQLRLMRKAAARESAEALHLETGNELLASLGKAGRAFAEEVADIEPNEFFESFAEPAGDSLLCALQRDIFQVTEPAASPEIGGSGEKREAGAYDLSLQIHCTHSPMRELQVLHDRLLELFEKLPSLAPKDILVAMPDVEEYAPFIEAVFGSPESEARRLPFSIADRSARAENSVARALSQLLELHGGRFTTDEVLRLLDWKPVRDRFGIAEGDLDTLRDCVNAAGIRWGINGAHRESLGLPAFEENSWQHGLDRLLLGFAMPADGETFYRNLLPLPGIEEELAVFIGKLADLCEKLFTKIPALGKPRTLSEWQITLRELLEIFVAENDVTSNEFKRVRHALWQLGELSIHYTTPIPFEILRTHLQTILGDAEGGFGFLAGTITFCSLKPMRSVPFRVICLLGLNDTAFPRNEPQLGFDLLSQRGKARTRRDDDRQLFLEHILSARDALILSYNGFSIRDNSPLPPSTVVSELLDYVSRNYQSMDSEMSPLQTVLHPLQAFSPRIFDRKNEELFSYSTSAAIAARISVAERLAPKPITPAPLAIRESESREVSVRDFARFFMKPVEFYVQKRLGIHFPELPAASEILEPLKLDHLIRWGVQERLAHRGTNDDSVEETQRLLVARGHLPRGWVGRTELRAAAQNVVSLSKAMAEARAMGEPESLTVDLTIDDWRIRGEIADIFPSGIVRMTPWEVKAKNRIETWILHLLHHAGTGASTGTTRLLSAGHDTQFSAPKNSRELLADLLEVYERGLCEPLPFFAKSSFAKAQADRDGKEDWKARAEWEKGECADAPHALCFRDVENPLGKEWSVLANRICGPLLDHMQEAEHP